jgi:hypothetical protein
MSPFVGGNNNIDRAPTDLLDGNAGPRARRGVVRDSENNPRFRSWNKLCLIENPLMIARTGEQLQ